MTLQALLQAIDRGVTETAEGKLAELVAAASEHGRSADVRKRLADAVGKNTPEADRVVNLLSAGLFGALPGGDSLPPDMATDKVNGVRVNPFLHRLRKAIMGLPAHDGVRQTNAQSFLFYPEYVTLFGPDNVRARITWLAQSHAGMGPPDDEIKVLFSLNGYFSMKQAKDWAKDMKGTTCALFGRAVYHAAGANMIGKVPPVVNSLGPIGVGLGAPHHTRDAEKKGPARPTINPVAFNENEEARRPSFLPGDIFLIRGDGDHQFFLGSTSYADHVGVVTEVQGDRIVSVDGGQNGPSGDSGKSSKRVERWLKFKPGAGWAFASQKGEFIGMKTYSTAENADIARKVAALGDPTQLILTAAGNADLKASWERLQSQRKDAEGKGNGAAVTRLDAQLEGLRKSAIARARTRIADPFGEVRTIQGWWQPERYAKLAVFDRSALKARLAAP